MSIQSFDSKDYDKWKFLKTTLQQLIGRKLFFSVTTGANSPTNQRGVISCQTLDKKL